MKRSLLATGLAILVGISTLSLPTYATTKFVDINETPQKAAIEMLFDRGIIHGTSETTFEPDKLLNHAEGILLLVNTFDLNLDTVRFIKEPKATDYFKNADDAAWYAYGFITASVNGVALDADLLPMENWTREDFINVLVTTYEQEYNLPMVKLIPVDIADEESITPEFSGAIQRALSYGLVELDAQNKINPKESLSRAEAAEMIAHLIEREIERQQ